MFKLNAVYVVPLSATIYNNLVKVFNDAACNKSFATCRDQVVALRKQFPTYSELLAMDLEYTEQFVAPGQQGQHWYGDISEARVVYNIQVVRAAANNFKPTLLIQGIKKE
ncbi:hypothetical protein Acj133p006 [Acinetobacter phage 133]|uniref:Uncharacterized protein n=1 Tax=Acinetobacter phage 133 TaxID=2919552 RepID=D9I5X2_9CAUD|nr:hypothetical protein Acj133p006 [Acinetobacter phage 133]ADJ19353.1 hypothetical protein Acj133p006 [Acinetobacter phage 133]